jgi:hypothetical protein
MALQDQANLVFSTDTIYIAILWLLLHSRITTIWECVSLFR